MSLRPEAPSWQPGADEGSAPMHRGGRNGGGFPHEAPAHLGGGAGLGAATTEAKLFIGQIPYECNVERLRELFEAYGRVRHIHILQDAHSGGGGTGGGGGRGRGGGGGGGQAGKGRAAFVTYDTTDEADTAIFTLHNRYRMLTNRPIQVSYAKNSPNISLFGRQAAIEVANANHSNPMPV
jgi:RNA recognition motif-containing protein